MTPKGSRPVRRGADGKRSPPGNLAGRLPYGELPEEDRRENEWSLANGARLFSAYATRREDKLWVITEWDRSVTTMLIPSEYEA